MRTLTATETYRESIERLRTTKQSALVFAADVQPVARHRAEASHPYDEQLPTRAGFDFEYADEIDSPVFATVDDGQAAAFQLGIGASGLAITGAAGAGKTTALQALTYGAIAVGALPVVIDVIKGAVDFEFARPYSIGWAATLEDATQVLAAAAVEVARRADWIADHGASCPPEPPIVIFIDDFSALLSGRAPDDHVAGDPADEARRRVQIADHERRLAIEVFLGDIAADGPAADVHLVLAAQRLVVSGHQSVADLKANLGRVLLGSSTTAGRVSALRTADDSPELTPGSPLGRGLWEPVGAARASVIQVWHAPVAEYAAALADRCTPVHHDLVLHGPVPPATSPTSETSTP